MKLNLQSIGLLAAVVSSALFVSCREGGNHVNPIEPGTTYPAAPTNLSASNVTTTSAALSWDAVTDAESYIVRFNNTTYPVSILTYELTGLTAETDYTWEVASVRGDEQSAWAVGSFTTAAEPRTQMVSASGAWYGQIYEGIRLENVKLGFLSFRTSGNGGGSGPYTGQELLLEMLIDPAKMDTTAENIDIPEGTYEFSPQYLPNTVLMSQFTVLSEIVNSHYGAEYTVTGGKLVVEGNHANYKMTIDVACMGVEGDVVYKAVYEGPVDMEVAAHNTFKMGDLGFATAITYFPNAIEGKNVDAYMFHAASSGVSLVDGKWQGSGWVLFSAQFHTALASNGTTIPDGTYNISGNVTPGTILAGYSGSSARHGLWAYDIEGGDIVRRFALVGGTVTSTRSNGSYTIEVNATDADGFIFTATVKGTGTGGSRYSAGM